MSPATRKARKLAAQTTELGFAAPQVIALRMARMAQAGWQPSAADRQEFTRMGAEKIAAFYESWQAMGWHSLQVQQQWLSQWTKQGANPLQWWQPWLHGASLPLQWQQAMLDVAGKGLRPVHRRAVANARRLGRVRKARQPA